jgi:hypothetical protein
MNEGRNKLVEKRKHKEREMEEKRKEGIKGGIKEATEREKRDQMNLRKKNGKHMWGLRFSWQ